MGEENKLFDQIRDQLGIGHTKTGNCQVPRSQGINISWEDITGHEPTLGANSLVWAWT